MFSSVFSINDKRIKQKSWAVGAHQLNRWADFVFNVKWTHKSDGFLKVWKDGKVVVDYKG